MNMAIMMLWREFTLILKMKNYVLIIVMGLLISGCASTEFGRGFGNSGGSERDADLFVESKDIDGPKRGVVINFIDGKPYNFKTKKMSGSSFKVGLRIGNYIDEPVTGTLEIYDTSAPEGFENIKSSPPLEPAFYQDDKFLKPSVYKYVTPSSYGYRQDQVHDATKPWFAAEVKYDRVSTFKIRPCFVDVGGKRDGSCSLSSGENILGNDYSRDPVIVSSVKKNLKEGDHEHDVVMILDIKVSNMGEGEIVDIYDSDEKGQVGFSILGTAEDNTISFDCEGDEIVGGDSAGLRAELNMEDDRSIEFDCTAILSGVVDPLDVMEVVMTLNYGYMYKEETPVLSVKG
jgi:hypothetical protein